MTKRKPAATNVDKMFQDPNRPPFVSDDWWRDMALAELEDAREAAAKPSPTPDPPAERER